MARHLLNISPTKVVSKELAETFHIKSEHTANYVGYLKRAYLFVGGWRLQTIVMISLVPFSILNYFLFSSLF